LKQFKKEKEMALSKNWKTKANRPYSAKIIGITDSRIKNVLLSESVEIQNCYIKVENIIASKTEAMCNVSIKKDSDEVENLSYKFSPNLSEKNFIAQAYEHLKTLPAFAGAIDC